MLVLNSHSFKGRMASVYETTDDSTKKYKIKRKKKDTIKIVFVLVLYRHSSKKMVYFSQYCINLVYIIFE